MRLTIVIASRNVDDPKLKDLLKSIDEQEFPKEDIETLVITEGTSESAKAIGIRRAKGEVIGILASDNLLTHKNTLKSMETMALGFGAVTTRRYYYTREDNLLNRYFSLMGGNDPLAFYMNKNDRLPHLKNLPIDPIKLVNKTVGDNGFFVRKSLIQSTDLENYYHIDNANEINSDIYAMPFFEIWHRTGGNILSFFVKRYSYGLQHAFNKNRRWHLVDFRQQKDVWRLICFIIFTITIVQPLFLSIRGFLKIRDIAWFLHPLICLMTLFTYALLVLNLGIKLGYQLLFAPMSVRRA